MEAPRKRYESNYIDGNNARRLSVVPDYSNDEYSERRTREGRQVQRRPAKKVRMMSVGQLLVLTFAIGVTLFVCIDYLRVQNDLTVLNKNVATVQSELLDLKDKNDATEQRMSSSVDLSNIYKIATKQLGMVHPKENQVVKYNRTQDDFVRQNKDIPEADDSSILEDIINQ
ncbi:FtsB/FtsL family cell division protein [Anaeromicropila herbilytica]|uniref:Cell division protein FtsL n=1 Tax=Anaeromicropila herbilytica TaxID=2785025 RepID=A0A7R7EMK0_9FIRM|nr:septum formation initiator family protein [Anaeromicropila herbilytica]BCN31557.1 hypothetical protein bsdtb5_28520 [Anaeromicropila herbilytica]